MPFSLFMQLIHIAGINGEDVGILEMDLMVMIESVFFSATLLGCFSHMCQWCTLALLSMD
jgi:hypothetical protein